MDGLKYWLNISTKFYQSSRTLTKLGTDTKRIKQYPNLDKADQEITDTAYKMDD